MEERFEGLIPSFGKKMGNKYMTGSRPGATDYLEVIDCEAVKEYIEMNVDTPKHDGQFASFEGFVTEKALGGDVPPSPSSANTIFYLSDGRVIEIEGSELTSAHTLEYYALIVRCEIGSSVTVIREGALNSCRALTGVTIGENVSIIEPEAFGYCEKLKSIIIPDSVTSLGDNAFLMCKSLTSATIGTGVTVINRETFAECSALTDVTIPNTVTSIEFEAFSGCRSLSTIMIPDSVINLGEGVFDGVTFSQPIYNANIFISLPREYSGSYLIEDGISSIYDESFAFCRSLTSLTIPDSVTNIGKKALWMGVVNEGVSCSLEHIICGGKTYDYNGTDELMEITLANGTKVELEIWTNLNNVEQ